jgi:hypothetical protein
MVGDVKGKKMGRKEDAKQRRIKDSGKVLNRMKKVDKSMSLRGK